MLTWKIGDVTITRLLEQVTALEIEHQHVRCQTFAIGLVERGEQRIVRKVFERGCRHEVSETQPIRIRYECAVVDRQAFALMLPANIADPFGCSE